MADQSVLVAIEAANSRHNLCYCGQYLDMVAHDGAIWLDCPQLTAPTRLPAALASFLREIAHDRVFVVELPITPEAEPVPARAAQQVALRPVTATA